MGQPFGIISVGVLLNIFKNISEETPPVLSRKS